MAKIVVDFNKCYEEQTKEVKEKFCRHDFYEIKNLLIFKKKVLTNKQMYGIIIIEREVMVMMNKTLVFDMDGTIANLYKVNGWLEDLRNENARPYIEAEPMYDMEVLVAVLLALKNLGWKIVVTSWLAKESTKTYDEMVRVAKRNWLERYDFPADEIHIVKYGTTKANCTRKLGGFQILVDDNEQVRKGWHLGETINANENILDRLIDLLEKEI